MLASRSVDDDVSEPDTPVRSHPRHPKSGLPASSRVPTTARPGAEETLRDRHLTIPHIDHVSPPSGGVSPPVDVNSGLRSAQKFLYFSPIPIPVVIGDALSFLRRKVAKDEYLNADR